MPSAPCTVNVSAVASIGPGHPEGGGREMSPSRRILLPLGGSLMSGALYRRAVKLARERNAELLIIRVTPRASSTRGNVDRVRRLLHALVTRSQRSGVPTRGLVLQGPMYEQIVQAARSHKPDVVV